MVICSGRNTGNPGEYDNVCVADDNGIRNRHICSERRKKRGVISFVHKGRWRPSAVISISREEDKHLKLGEAILIAAPFGWGYGYMMTYFLFLEPVNPGCGPLQLAAVQARYPGLGSVSELLAGGATGLEVRYLVDSRRRELDLALHCLLTSQEGAKLANMLDMFDSLAHTRIDFST